MSSEAESGAAPKRKPREYRGERITVRYDLQRCMHAAECVDAGLRSVFDRERRPWVDPDGADPEKVVDVVERCPSGALTYERTEGPAEAPEPTLVRPQPGSALYLRGDLRLFGPDEAELTREPRLALCRCGRSGNKPFCDHSHAEGEPWNGPGEVAGDALSGEVVDTTAPLEVRASRDGPLLLRGPFSLRSADGATVRWGEKAALCRCGGSGNKPFCDGTHARIGFRDPEPEADDA